MPTLTDRLAAITFKGQPMTLLGAELKPGDAAPDFTLTGGDLKTVNLDGALDGANAAVFIAVPSLDTSVCSTESHTFNQRIAEFGDDVRAYVVSMDLPFAMARWCGNEGDVKLGMLSDYRDHSFGENYSVYIKDLGLLARCVFVVGADKRVKYVQLVKEVTQEPNYDAVIAAAKAAAA